MPTAPRADRVRNDERILQAAARLLARDPHVSVQAIADEAGVVRRTVYRRYPSREDLVGEMARTASADAVATVARFPGWDDGPWAFRALVTLLVGFAQRYPVAVLDHDAHAGSPVDAHLVAILTEGIRRGALRADVDPVLLNGVLLHAVSTMVRLHPDRAPDRVADEITNLVLTGAISPDAGPPGRQTR